MEELQKPILSCQYTDQYGNHTEFSTNLQTPDDMTELQSFMSGLRLFCLACSWSPTLIDEFIPDL